MRYPLNLKLPRGNNGTSRTIKPIKPIFRGIHMVYQEPSQGKKYKPRGRPFPKGNKRGKLENSVLADTRHSVSDEGGNLDSKVKHEGSYMEIEGDKGSAGQPVLNELPKLVINAIEEGLREAMSSPVEEKEEARILETLDFINGENKLSIAFSAVNNRRFRIQIFLNGDTEVRPVTYQGSSSGYSFWKLLKGALKK